MRKPLHVLHLEDNPDFSLLVRDMLEKEGLAVEMQTVANLRDFLGALERTKFDIILADYALPGYTGLQALALSHEKCPDTPFLLVSGTIGEQVAVDSLKQGATDYILKQCPERLIPSVRRALQEAQERHYR